MPGAPIDTAVVAIEPDLSRFARQTDDEIKQAFGDIDPTVRELMASIERRFDRLADEVSASLRDMNHTATSEFARMANAAESAGREVGDDFQRGGERAERALEELSRRSKTEFDKVERNASGVGSKLGGLGGLGAGLALTAGVGLAAAGLEQLGQFGLTTAAKLEQVKIAFQSLTGSVQAGNAQFAELQKFAAATPFTFNDLVVGAQRFDAFARTVGFSQSQLIPFMTTIGNLVSVTGGGAQSLNTITTAMGQIASQGKLTLDNINQINDAVPGFSSVAALAAVRGQTTAQVMDEISKGSIDATTGIHQLVEGMNRFPGAAGAMEKQSQTLMGVWSTFTDTIGQALSGAFTPVIPQIKDALSQITPIIGDAIGQIAPALGGLLAQVLPLVGSLVQGIVPILTPLLNALGPGLAALAPAIAPLGAALGQIATAIAPILPLAGQLIAALAGALAPVISALAPLITGLVTAIQPLIGPIAQILAQIGGTLAAIILPVAQALGQVFAALGPPLGQVIAALGTALAPILQMIGPLVKVLVDAFMPLLPAFISLIPPVIQIVVAITPLIGLLAQLLTIGITLAAPLLKLQATLLALLTSKVVAPLLMLIAQALTLILKPLIPVVGWLSQFATWIGSLNWGKIGQAILGAFSAAWTAILNFFKDLPGQIGNFLSSLPGMLASLVTQAFQAMFFAIGFGIGMIIGELMALPGQVIGFFEMMWHNSVQMAANLINEVTTWLSQLPGRVIGFVTQTWTSAVTLFQNGVNNVVTFAQSLPSRVASAVSGLWNSIKGAIGDLFSNGAQIGRDLLNGMKNGIEGAVRAVIDAVKNAVHNVIQGAKDALHIGSPSRVFIEIGKHTVEGFAQGIDDNADQAVQSITNLVTPNVTAGSVSSSSVTGGIVFSPGAISVTLGAGVTPDQAYAAGQQVGQGIMDTLAAARDIARVPRTV